MHIDPKSEIVGHPALLIRDLLRKVGDSSVQSEFIKLREFMERVREVNVNPHYLYKVKEVVLFGSYLTLRERINDIDVAVEVGPKYGAAEQEERNGRRRREAIDQGKHFSHFIDEMFWPEIEVNCTRINYSLRS